MQRGKPNTTQRGDTMNVTFESVGGFEDTINWLNRAASASPDAIIHQIGREGVQALRSNTPTKTGATAAGWDYRAIVRSGIVELSWVNNAHMGATANIARIIDSGHGTGWGGYVPPRPYIRRAMDPIFDSVGDRLIKELTD